MPNIRFKKIVSIAFAFFICCFSIGLMACNSNKTQNDGTFLYELLEDGTYQVSAYDKNDISGDIVIPSEYNGRIVSTIGSFSSCLQITSVDIPDTITEINKNAFYYCTNIKSITIGESVKTFGDSAFGLCKSLAELNYNAESANDLSKTTDSQDSLSGNLVFAGIGTESNGVTVNIGNSVKNIPSYLFYPSSADKYAPNITTITIPSNIEKIGRYAFQCSNLNEIIFENTENWYRTTRSTYSGGTLCSNDFFSTSTTVADYLKNYGFYYWYQA